MSFVLSEPEHGFLFVHIPKTGGTSIALALDWYRHYWTDKDIVWWTNYKSRCTPEVFRAINGGHPRLLDYIAFMEAHGYPTPRIYCVVRNPWDKAVSGYHYNQGHPPKMAFGPWMEWSYNMWKTDPVESKMWHQHYFIGFPGYQEYEVNVLRFEDGGPPAVLETIKADLDLKKVAPIKHIHKSKRRPYKEYFSNQRHIDMVAEIFKTDIEMFGYDF